MIARLGSTFKKNAWLALGGILVFSALTFPFFKLLTTEDTVRLTAEEKAWLKAHPVIRLAPDPDFPPTEFLDANGAYRGLAADYMALVQKRLGIRFQIVKLDNWAQVLKKARQREVDVLAAVTKTPERSEYLLFSKPYLQFPAVIVTRDNYMNPLNLRNLAGKKVDIKAGYAARYYVTTNYPQITVDVVPDIRTGLRHVSEGSCDAMLENLLSVSYYMEKEFISNLHIAGEAEFVYRIAIGVRNDWPVLRTILDKSLAAISAEERNVVYHKWVPLGSHYLLINKSVAWPLLIGAGIVLLSVILVFIWNRSLARQVDRRTRDQHAELEERTRIEAALRESEEKFRVLADTSPGAIMLFQDEQQVYVNKAFTLMSCYSEQECLSMKFWELIEPEYRDMVRSYGLSRLQGDEAPSRYEAKYRSRDGISKWILISAGTIQYRGRPAGITCIFDITECKQIVEELHQAKADLEQQVSERTADLQLSMEKLRFTQFAVEKAHDQAFWHAKDGRIIYVNESACKSLGYDRDELVGMSVSEIDPDMTGNEASLMSDMVKEEGSLAIERRHRAKNGRTYPVEIRANYVVFDGNEYLCNFVNDISERLLRENALRESESSLKAVAAALQQKQGLLRILLDSIPDLIFYKDTEGFYLGCNKAFEAFVGKAEQEIVGSTDFELFPDEIAVFFRKMDKAMLGTMTSHSNEEWVVYPDGRQALMETLKTPYFDCEGKLLGLIGISRDITRRKKAEDSLRRSHEILEERVRERTGQLTSLAAELSRAEELERRRIATELHDQVAQTLALSKIKLGTLLFSGKCGENREDIREVMDHLSVSIEEIRSLTFQLSPPILHEMGLSAALEWLADEFSEKYGLRIDFHDDGHPKPVEEEIAGALFRMSRELLVNIIKHARAENVQITSGIFSGRVRVRISDDGVGFDLSCIERPGNATNSYGLLNIHHRMKHLGGQLIIEPRVGGGTAATLEIPCGIARTP
ncbi:MAG: PAS domain S-box protein [Geobacteraceae bacterium]|nr:PAS domain S-box protein [Geobacteraceae bacterium]